MTRRWCQAHRSDWGWKWKPTSKNNKNKADCNIGIVEVKVEIIDDLDITQGQHLKDVQGRQGLLPVPTSNQWITHLEWQWSPRTALKRCNRFCWGRTKPRRSVRSQDYQDVHQGKEQTQVAWAKAQKNGSPPWVAWRPTVVSARSPTAMMLATRPTVMSAWRLTAMLLTSPQWVARRCFEGHEGSFSTTRPHSCRI